MSSGFRRTAEREYTDEGLIELLARASSVCTAEVMTRIAVREEEEERRRRDLLQKAAMFRFQRGKQDK